VKRPPSETSKGHKDVGHGCTTRQAPGAKKDF
jgi:hypothetical protein